MHKRHGLSGNGFRQMHLRLDRQSFTRRCLPPAVLRRSPQRQVCGNGHVYQAIARGRWQPRLAWLTVRR